MTLAEFVERRFLPDHVAAKRSSGKTYFRTILNHVIPPEQVARAFSAFGEKPAHKLRSDPDWPYIGHLPLCDITPANIQRLILAAMSRRYSAQTATHIRNVVRVIFSHASRAGYFAGENPANLVDLPAMTRREVNPLSPAVLKQVIQKMGHPERELAMFALLTELSIVEICGLQWKHLNLSRFPRPVDGEILPALTIAVGRQIYKGESNIPPVVRRKLVRIPDLLCSMLKDLKTRKRFTSPDDFVLATRNGTSIHPENLAARRLKSIGASLQIPSLSWRSFTRTRISLRLEYGSRLNSELIKIPTEPPSHMPAADRREPHGK